MLHQVGGSFDLYYDARKHKIKRPLFVSLGVKGLRIRMVLRYVDVIPLVKSRLHTFSRRQAVLQFVDCLHHKPDGRGIDSRLLID
jgi:hypothetical protein